jgi:hypothetical protein
MIAIPYLPSIILPEDAVPLDHLEPEKSLSGPLPPT